MVAAILLDSAALQARIHRIRGEFSIKCKKWGTRSSAKGLFPFRSPLHIVALPAASPPIIHLCSPWTVFRRWFECGWRLKLKDDSREIDECRCVGTDGVTRNMTYMPIVKVQVKTESSSRRNMCIVYISSHACHRVCLHLILIEFAEYARLTCQYINRVRLIVLLHPRTSLFGRYIYVNDPPAVKYVFRCLRPCSMDPKIKQNSCIMRAR